MEAHRVWPSVRDLLERTTVADIIALNGQTDILVLSENTTIEKALDELTKHNVLSAPVQVEDSLDYIGMVDVLDILTYVLSLYSEGQEESIQWSAWCNDLKELKVRGKGFGQTPIKVIINKSKVDPFLPVEERGTLSQVLEEVFCKGVHRAPVLSRSKAHTISGIISQSDVLQFLANQVVSNEELVAQDRTVGELNLGTKYVITMSSSAQAIHAFYLMYFHKISAVAIVDKNEQLVANLSASDIRGMHTTNFEALLKPVMEFLLLKHGGDSRQLQPQKRPLPVITCTPYTLLSTVILQLAIYRLHRVWVVNEHRQPIGVISLTDIMRLFA